MAARVDPKGFSRTERLSASVLELNLECLEATGGEVGSWAGVTALSEDASPPSGPFLPNHILSSDPKSLLFCYFRHEYWKQTRSGQTHLLSRAQSIPSPRIARLGPP